MEFYIAKKLFASEEEKARLDAAIAAAAEKGWDSEQYAAARVLACKLEEDITAVAAVCVTGAVIALLNRDKIAKAREDGLVTDSMLLLEHKSQPPRLMCKFSKNGSAEWHLLRLADRLPIEDSWVCRYDSPEFSVPSSFIFTKEEILELRMLEKCLQEWRTITDDEVAKVNNMLRARLALPYFTLMNGVLNAVPAKYRQEEASQERPWRFRDGTIVMIVLDADRRYRGFLALDRGLCSYVPLTKK